MLIELVSLQSTVTDSFCASGNNQSKPLNACTCICYSVISFFNYRIHITNSTFQHSKSQSRFHAFPLRTNPIQTQPMPRWNHITPVSSTKMSFFRQLTAIKPQQSPFIHCGLVPCSHTNIPLPMDPNSLGIHQLHASIVNLIPLNFLPLATPVCGPLGGHHSITGDPTGMGRQAESPNFLEWGHFIKPEPEHPRLTYWVPPTHC